MSAQRACAVVSSPRRRLLVRAILESSALVLALFYACHLTRTLRDTPPPSALPTNGDRLGIPDAKRHTIFNSMANDEPRARVESAEKFPGDPWSIEDERAAHERDRARELAGTFKVSVSAVYLILDEGIRAHWPAQNKQPLEAGVVPLKPRPR